MLLRAAVLAVALVVPAGYAARVADDSLIVSTEWLAAHAKDPNVVVLQVTTGNEFADGHIPGAHAIPYGSFTTNRDGLQTELPPPEALRDVFERAGVSDESIVVVYAMHAPMATRALFTLDWIGHRRFAFLDGGLPKWKREGRPVTTDAPAVVRGHLAPQIRPELVADADWVSAHIGARGVSFIDTRSDVEYAGAGEHRGMPSAGHVAGARQLQWEQLFAPGDDLQLKPRKELEQMYNDRTRAGDTVVTYCWVGYRASATWFAARAIGRTVKLYDGSYQDWRKRQLPVTPGTTP